MELTKTISSVNTLSKMDRLGTCVSTACAIHCMLVPFVVSVLPLVGLSFLAHTLFEICMIIFAVTLATVSLCWGAKVHGNYRTLFFVVSAALFFMLAHEIDPAYHWYFMAFGGFSLAAGHVLNRKLCNSCQDCCHH